MTGKLNFSICYNKDTNIFFQLQGGNLQIETIHLYLRKTSNILSILIILFGAAISANAAVFVVSNTNDSGEGSFRQAVENANNAPTDDIIQFSTIFNNPNGDNFPADLDILNSGNLTIEGNNAQFVHLLGDSNGIVIRVQIGAVVTINDVTIKNGGDAPRGGGISNKGTLVINNCVVRDNYADGIGGGIYTETDMTINNSVIRDNFTQDSVGGGILVESGTLTILDSFISDNNADDSGGGIYNNFNAVLIIKRSKINRNSANERDGGGLFNRGTLSLIDSLVQGNTSDNDAGGIYNAGLLNIINTTVTGNVATGEIGGGIKNTGAETFVFVRNSTIAYNRAEDSDGIAGGIDSLSGTFDMGNTIVSNNSAGESAPNIRGTITSSGYNIFTNLSGANIIGNMEGNQFNTDPRLNTLAENGGVLATLSLQDNSPAIDAGNNALAVDQNGTPIMFDQRGEGFDRISNGTVDIGAFEVQAVTPPNTNQTKFDFDGDGKADISVFRPANGTWYFQNSGSGFSAFAFGISTDRIVSADYDGDGKTDIAVFRDGFWYVVKSSDNSFEATSFGQAGDKPFGADYDGDGRADKTVFRDGNWYILNSADGSFRGEQFGLGTDAPLTGDFDGDGRADLTVFRDGYWYINQSTSGFSAAQFGLTSDKPVPADYDGDGQTDVAVFRDGSWYILNAADGSFRGERFGFATDTAVPADYDGDGRADIAVYRDGTWYLQQSTSGFAAANFGVPTDVPVPTVYLP